MFYDDFCKINMNILESSLLALILIFVMATKIEYFYFSLSAVTVHACQT